MGHPADLIHNAQSTDTHSPRCRYPGLHRAKEAKSLGLSEAAFMQKCTLQSILFKMHSSAAFDSQPNLINKEELQFQDLMHVFILN